MAEVRRKTKKLVSLMGDAEDVARSTQLALVPFCQMWEGVVYASNMLVRHCVFHFTMLSLCIPVFAYNKGTWALTQAESTRLSSFQHTHLNC